MNVIERNLSRAGSKWKWLRFIEDIGLAASILMVMVLLLGIALDRFWITSPTAAQICVAILIIAGFIAAFVIFAIALDRNAERKWLAQNLEQNQPELQDRLNTLVFLDRFKLATYSKFYWFRHRIRAQAEDVLRRKEAPASFPLSRAILHNGIFILLLIGAIYFYNTRHPWRNLHAHEKTQSTSAGQKPFDLAMPDADSLEQKAAWGETRITDPARDLRITKVDTVQLQIEAASSHTLTNATWFTTVNGLGDQAHRLPPPSEPKYAAYQPIIYADEFDLKDWDVMTYYAQTRTDQGDTYGSEVYFLEVRPFREDILKMPGGESGSAYQVLGQMTDLINRQQHVIRETHHYVQSPPQTDKLKEQDRGKLADAESELSDAAWHLYADIAAKMENKPIGAALDQLGLANKTLSAASECLRTNQMTQAREQERLALRQLIDTRKLFQKAVTDHPDDFKDKPVDEDKSPIADDSKGKLNEMAEFRNEEKATRDFVDQLVQKQKVLNNDAAKAGNQAQQKLAQRQRDLKTELDQFSAQHPQLFKGTTNELAQALDAMNKSAASLDKRSTGNRKEPETALGKTEELALALAEETVGRQLTSAYRLKKMLDQQIDRLEQVEQKPADINQDDLRKTSDQAKETTWQLKQITEEKATASMFGPDLGKSLGDENKNALDKELDKLGQSQSPEERQQLASKTGQDLRKISKAFEQSQPNIVNQSKKNDPLKEQSSLEKGMEQLRNLLGRLQGERPLSESDLQKLAREAQLNLREGVAQNIQSKETGRKLLLLLDEELKPDTRKIDLAGIKRLISQLEDLTTEVKDPTQATNAPAVTTVDSGKLPPAYRGRIETYFRKLSETK